MSRTASMVVVSGLEAARHMAYVSPELRCCQDSWFGFGFYQLIDVDDHLCPEVDTAKDGTQMIVRAASEFANAVRNGGFASQMSNRLTVGLMLLGLGLVNQATLAAGAERVSAWGNNTYGQIGKGSFAPPSGPHQHVPTFVQDLTDVVGISAGFNHSLAVTSDGSAWGWGINHYGQCGQGFITQTQQGGVLVPAKVRGPGGVGFLSNVRAVAAGFDYSLALLADGTVWAWGYPVEGGLGTGSQGGSLYPTQTVGPNGVGFLTDVERIAAGDGGNISIALKRNGTVWTWGAGAGMGNGSYQITQNTPVQVSGPGGVGVLSDIVAIDAGENFGIAVRRDGTVWTWGLNARGQLGIGSVHSNLQNTPVQVVGTGGNGFLTGIVGIAGGRYHALAVKSDGSVWSWGANAGFALGIGDTNGNTNIPFPVQVVNLGNVSVVDAGVESSMALTAQGNVYCWGAGHSGQLGDNNTQPSAYPSQTNLSGKTHIASGGFHNLAMEYRLPDVTPPSCSTGSVVSGAGSVYVPVTVSDAESGLGSIQLTANSANCKLEWNGPGGLVSVPIGGTINISPTVANAVVRAVKLNSSNKARVELRVTDVAGNVTTCDPVVATLTVKKDRRLERTFSNLPEHEHFIRLENSVPGLDSAKVWYNGRLLWRGALTSGRIVHLDGADYARRGKRNQVRIVVTGVKSSNAVLMIGDSSLASGVHQHGPGQDGERVNLDFGP